MTDARQRPKRRAAKPKPPIAVFPVVLTQNNAFSLTGLTPRRFLEFVRYQQVPHFRDGKLVLVDAEVFRERLAELATVVGGYDEPEAEDEGEEQTADDILRSIGRADAIGASRRAKAKAQSDDFPDSPEELLRRIGRADAIPWLPKGRRK